MLGIHALNASLGLLLEIGIGNIADAIRTRTQFLVDNIHARGGIILSSTQPERRAGIVTFRIPDDDLEARYHHLMKKGVICAMRGGGIRFSPHFYIPENILQHAIDISFESINHNNING